MNDEEREERAEARSRKRRQDRINVVWAVLKAKQPKRTTTRDIAAATGYSPKLVRSTINLIRRNQDELGWQGQPVAYDPSTHEVWIAATWIEEQRRIDWLLRHVKTRLYSFQDFLDVAIATWPGKVPFALTAISTVADSMTGLIDQAIQQPAPKPSMSATRPPKLHG